MLKRAVPPPGLRRTPRDVYEGPATRFVADFIGASTIVRGRAVGRDRVALSPELTIKVSAVGALAMGRHAELAIRPERVQLAAEGKREARHG